MYNQGLHSARAVVQHSTPAEGQAHIAGDPIEAVLLALEAAEKVFGVDVNSRGYKVPKSCGVIQGDGISIDVLDKILQAVMSQGYSAQVLFLTVSCLSFHSLLLTEHAVSICCCYVVTVLKPRHEGYLHAHSMWSFCRQWLLAWGEACCRG